MKKNKCIFKIGKDEKVIYSAHVNMCNSDSYFHAVIGDAILTDKRFLFKSDLSLTKIDQRLELNVEDIDFVSKTGVPFFTRSLYISCSKKTGKNYRFNVYSLLKWIKSFNLAIKGHKN